MANEGVLPLRAASDPQDPLEQPPPSRLRRASPLSLGLDRLGGEPPARLEHIPLGRGGALEGVELPTRRLWYGPKFH